MGGPGKCSQYSDLLWAGQLRDQILVGATFSTAIHVSSGVHPAPYTMGTGSFPGVKWPGRGFNHPFPSSAEVKERAELYLSSPPPPRCLHGR
jgi:hypothetical protein